MKLRLKGNSVRFRLTRGEVRKLASQNSVEEGVRFASGGIFCYALKANAELESITAAYEDDRMIVVMPRERVEHWANSEEVGIDADVDGVRVLIEKDFACLKPRAGEDESDMFPHPDPGSCEA